MVARASALRPIEDLAPLWIDVEDEAVARLLVGFDARALFPDAAVPSSLTTTPLTPAGACDPALPAPSWVVRAQRGALSSEESGAVPPLTAAWLKEQCAPPPELALDLRCAEPRCIVERLELDACTVELRTTGCALGNLRLSYQGEALKCLQLSGSPWQCDQDASAPFDRDIFRCDPRDSGRVCTVELIDAARDEAPELEVRRAVFGELPPAAPDASRHTNFTLPRRLSEVGQGFDLVALPGRIAVTAIADGDPVNCPFGQERKLVFFDPETLHPTGTATAPRCLEHLGRDGENFVGGFKGEDGAVMFGRFDRQGRLLRAIDVFDGENEADVLVIAVRELPIGWALLLDEITHMDTEKASRVVFVNRALEVIGHSDVGEFMYALSAVPPDRAAAWIRDGGSGSGLRIFASDGSNSENAPLQILGAYRPSASIVAGNYLVLFASDDKEISSYRLDPLEPLGIFGTFAEPGYVIAAETWIDEKLILAGGASGGPRTGYQPELYFVDPAESRFLPGKRSLEGLGPITQIRKGEGDTYWMLLPWDGAIARVRPR